MKIVHIVTNLSGGAGIATLRLHKALKAEEIDSHIIHLYGNDLDNNIVKITQISTRIERIHRKIISLLSIFKTQKTINSLKRKKKADLTIYTSINTPYKIENHPLVKSADIIHLHWIAGLVNYKSFFNSVKKPIVWTLHDKNPLLGGFHLLIDKIRNTDLVDIEEKVQREKREILIKNKNKVTFVCPSKSLRQYLIESSSLKEFDNHHIYNAIDFSIFKMLDKEKCKDILEVNSKSTNFLIIADDLNVFHKGMDILIESLNRINTGLDVQFLIVGNSDFNLGSRFKTKNFGLVKDNALLNIILNAADALLIPSREDNLPNVMIESLAVGTPIIGTPIGGINDLLEKDDKLGIRSENTSPEKFANAIELFLRNKDSFKREYIHDFAMSNFDSHTIANQHINLYKNVLNSD